MITRKEIRAMADDLLIETLLVTVLLDREGGRGKLLLTEEVVRRGLVARAEARAIELTQQERKRLGE